MYVVAIDLDGTLLHSNGHISKANIRSLQSLKEKGFRILISTGRDVKGVRKILETYNFPCDGIVASNGSVLMDQQSIFHELTIDKDTVEQLIDWLHENRLYYHLNTKDGLNSHPDTKTFYLQELHEFLKDQPNRASLEEKLLKKANDHAKKLQYTDMSHTDDWKNGEYVYKILILSFFPDKLASFRTEWKNEKNIALTSSGRQNVEVMNRLANKGTGLQTFIDHLNWDVDRLITIGDNLNDLPMFAIADYAIAMENADIEVKKKAHYITAHHDNDGVAEAVYHYILSNLNDGSLKVEKKH